MLVLGPTFLCMAALQSAPLFSQLLSFLLELLHLGLQLLAPPSPLLLLLLQLLRQKNKSKTDVMVKVFKTSLFLFPSHKKNIYTQSPTKMKKFFCVLFNHNTAWCTWPAPDVKVQYQLPSGFPFMPLMSKQNVTFCLVYAF